VIRWLRLAGPLVALAGLFLSSQDRSAADSRSGITPPEYPQVGLPDPIAAQELLSRFRGSGFAAGDYYLEFMLLHRPRHGEEEHYTGRAWGGPVGQGMMLRLALATPAGASTRLLILSGPEPAAWRESGGRVGTVDARSLFEPLVGTVDITAFDLQMPYLYWADARVVGLNRIRGRPAYAFVFRPPAAIAAVRPDLAAVRAFIDTEFDRPLQVEIIGPDGRVTKTLSIVELKKVDGQYLLEEFDERNEVTRDYTRFQLTAVALGRDAPAGVLSPEGLANPAPGPPAARITRLDR
jgi:hypothetical protein